MRVSSVHMADATTGHALCGQTRRAKRELDVVRHWYEVTCRYCLRYEPEELA